MASSSHNNFEDSTYEAFDQYFDHQFNEAFENLCNTFGDQTEEKKTRKKEFLSKETVKKVISDYGMIILVTLQRIQKIYSDDDFV